MRASDDGRVRFTYAKLLKNLMHYRVAFQIQPGKRHQVLRQKIANAKSIARVTRTDHAQTGELARLAHQLPACDERLQDEIAQLRILIQNLTERCLRYSIHFAIRLRDRANQFRATGQMPDVAGEAARAENPDRLRLIAGYIDDVDLTRLHDIEFRIAIARSKQCLSGTKLFRRRTCIATQFRDLLFA